MVSDTVRALWTAPALEACLRTAMLTHTCQLCMSNLAIPGYAWPSHAVPWTVASRCGHHENLYFPAPHHLPVNTCTNLSSTVLHVVASDAGGTHRTHMRTRNARQGHVHGYMS